MYAKQAPIVEFGRENGIETEAYSLLMYEVFKRFPGPWTDSLPSFSPITQLPGGPLDKPLKQLQTKYNATADQILMAWAKSKGVVVVT